MGHQSIKVIEPQIKIAVEGILFTLLGIELIREANCKFRGIRKVCFSMSWSYLVSSFEFSLILIVGIL